MSKAGKHGAPSGALRRWGQVLAAALMLTVVLLSQRGVQVVGPGAAGERCSLAPPVVAAAAAAARHGQAAPAAASTGSTLSDQPSTVGSSGGSASGGSNSSSSSAGGGTGSPATGQGVAAATGQDVAAATCDLAVEPSQWADSCVLLRDACVDQGSIILYGREHGMSDSSPGTAPYEIAPTPDYRKYIFLHRGSVSGWKDCVVWLAGVAAGWSSRRG